MQQPQPQQPAAHVPGGVPAAPRDALLSQSQLESDAFKIYCYK